MLLAIGAGFVSLCGSFTFLSFSLNLPPSFLVIHAYYFPTHTLYSPFHGLFLFGIQSHKFFRQKNAISSMDMLKFVKKL